MMRLPQLADRFRTAAILLSGVIPLALQPGPVAGEAVASRHVNRLLDELPESEGEIPNDVALQCHLISLVSDAVTLRAAPRASDTQNWLPQDDLGYSEIRHVEQTNHPVLKIARLIDQTEATPAPGYAFQEQPRGP